MAMLKQLVLVRTDLNLPRGLLAAQIAHIHAEVMRQCLVHKLEEFPELTEWMVTPYLFVHALPNAEAYNYYLAKAKQVQSEFDPHILHMWSDTLYLSFYDGHRDVFPNVDVGFSIGPIESDIAKRIVGDLPLLP